jgi:hypothetical protein
MRVEPTVAAQSEHARKCLECSDVFAGVRADAAYCSNKCRQAAYRRRTYRADDYAAEGWPYRPNEYGYPGPNICQSVVFTGERCPHLAVWRVHRRNMYRPVDYVAYWCAEHLPADRPSDIRVDVLPERGRSGRKRMSASERRRSAKLPPDTGEGRATASGRPS